MTTDDVEIDDIRSLVCVQLGLARVVDEDHLVSDLGAESADVVNLIAAVEDKYGIEIAEDEIPDIHTVRDLYERVRGRR
ncbi:MAG: acyl carrier protein [bacterium]|nr:acyl carrier protein [bacterium]